MNEEFVCYACEHAIEFHGNHVVCALYRDWQFRRHTCPYFSQKEEDV